MENQTGGESRKVGELRPVVGFELEAWPEPKALSREKLLALLSDDKNKTYRLPISDR